MKHWPSQLFPIILLAALAGLTFWLQKTVDRGDAPRDRTPRHEIDSKAENFVARRFDENGVLKYQLAGPSMVHFPDDDSAELQNPLLTAFREAAPPVTLTARNARVSSKGETVYLWDDVVATREATAERPAMIARMPDLVAQPEAGTAFTNSPVEVTEGASWLKGVGADLDHNASTLVLRSQVRGMYIRPKAQP